MGFWDDVGEVFSDIGDDIGGAWSWAGSQLNKADNSDFAKGLKDLNKTLGDVTTINWSGEHITKPTLGAVGDTTGAVYEYGVARPISTVGMAAANTNTMFSPDAWSDAWDKSDQISPGQVLYTDLATLWGGEGLSFGTDKDSVDRRNQVFHNTWHGQIASGAIDLAGNWFADPLVMAGKAATAARLASTTISTGDIAGAINAVRTGVDASGSEGRAANKLDALSQRISGKTAPEIMAMPEIKASPDAGALAYFLARANDSFPGDSAKATAARRRAHMDIIGASLGDQASIARIKDRQSALAAEMKRMSTPTVPTQAGEKFSWDDSGQGMIDYFNSIPDDTLTASRDAVDREMLRLQRVIDASGSTNKISPTYLESAVYNESMNRLHESVITSGMGSRPIRVVNGSTSARLPGYINTVDPTAGYDQVSQYVRGMKYTPNPVKQDLLNKFIIAATKGDRRNVVSEIESQMFNDFAAKYGINSAKAAKILNAAQSRRTTYVNALKSRLYSAAPGAKSVSLVDPEDDITHVFSIPLVQSQLESSVPLTDPVMLENALKEGTQSRTLERWADRLPDQISPMVKTAATSVTDAATGVGDQLDEFGRMFTKAWKDAALFRGAYPLRVQVDTQMRLAAHLGMLQYMLKFPSIVGSELKFIGKRGASYEDRLASALRSLEKPLDYRGVNIAPSEGVDDTNRIVRTLSDNPNGGMADLGNDVSRNELRQHRMDGQWGYVDPTAKNWLQAWTRAVNQQIMNSPVARKALETSDPSALIKFIGEDPAARKEWLEMSQGWKSQNEWVNAVASHVNHLIPQSLRPQLIENGTISQNTAKKFFSNVDDRMVVHGESLVPTQISSFTRNYNELRKGWYRFASDAPELLMGRSPLYSDSFKEYMRRQIDKHAGAEIDSSALDAMRRNADKLARRDVGRIMFDSSDTSNMASAMRFVSPFFAAWEDTMKKWGGLFYAHPDRAVRFKQAWDMPAKAGISQKDDNGNEWIVLPSSLVPGPAGSSWRVRKDSLNIIFQGEPWWMPGYGPMVSVPAGEIVKKAFPESTDNPIIKNILPFGVNENGPVDQLMPSWIRQAKNVFGNTQDYANTYSLLMAQQIAQANTGDVEAQKRLSDGTAPDFVASQTRNWFILRAVSAWGSPVTATPNPKFQFYIDKAHEYRSQYGEDWQNKFLEDFPEYFEMSLSLSSNETGISASSAAMDATRKYRSLISQNPDLGWMFVGADNIMGTGGNAYNQGVHTWQMTNTVGPGSNKTFRGRKDPAEAIQSIEAEKGWIQYNQAMTQFNLALEDRGLHSFSQKRARDISAAKKAYIADLTASNPSWARAYAQQDTGKVQYMVQTAMDAMRKDSSLADRPDMQALQTYIEGRQQFRDILSSRKSKSLSLNPDLEAAWGMFTQDLVKDNVGFEQMWNRVLSHDDLNKDLSYAGQ